MYFFVDAASMGFNIWTSEKKTEDKKITEQFKVVKRTVQRELEVCRRYCNTTGKRQSIQQNETILDIHQAQTHR